MNKWSFFAVFCCILLLCALPAAAQAEQALPVITITYAAGAPLSHEEAVDAQVTIARDGQEHAFPARLRLNAAAMDSEERELPQRSLYIEGADMRFVLYNDGGDALRTKLLSTVCSGLVAQCPVAVPVRTQEPVEVYVNGDYRGLYSRREDIADAIARFEGLDSAATLNVADVNTDAFCGDASGIANALQQLKGKARLAGGNVAALLHRLCDGNLHFDVSDCMSTAEIMDAINETAKKEHLPHEDFVKFDMKDAYYPLVP